MHQHAEICLQRKKRVQDSFRSNTFRIFNENVPEKIKIDEVYHEHKYATRSPEETELLKTHNVPQPCNAKFIRTNTRFLNAPIVHMETDNTKDEQFKWWATDSVKSERPKAPYSLNTTQRADYQPIAPIPVTPATNKKGRAITTAIIPTLHPLGQSKALLEHMSFIHQYDSRKLHDQPHEGGRQGTFIWTELTSLQGQNAGPPNRPCVKLTSMDVNTKDLHNQLALPYSSSSGQSPCSLHPKCCQTEGGVEYGTGVEERSPRRRRAEASVRRRGGEADEGSRPRRVESGLAETVEASEMLEKDQE